MDIALAVAATLIALAFSLSTLERWLARRSPHEAAWSAALAMFAVASGFLAAGAGLGWSEWTFRGFYFFGAIANVPFLATGTVYLLAGRKTADRTLAAVALAVAFAAGVVAVAPFTGPVPVDELARGSDVFGPLPRILAAVSSGGGAVVVLGGAVLSALRYRRGRMMAANLLIAAGTLITGASGLLNSVLDEMTGFAVTLVVGVSVLFAGFLVATTGRRSAVAALTAGVSEEPGAAASRPAREEASPRT